MKFIVLVCLAVLLYSSNAQAYVGPGLGAGAIAVIGGIILSVLMAIIGIFWYPIKRLFKKKDDQESLEASEDLSDGTEVGEDSASDETEKTEDK